MTPRQTRIAQILALIALIMLVLFLFCQIPIDAKPGADWVTISDAYGNRVIGYVLVTGEDVGTDPLDTSKGRFELKDMEETWLAASNPDIAVDPAAVRALKWTVETAKGDNWRKTIAQYISKSSGLLDSAGAAPWSLKAKSGKVTWTDATPPMMEGLAMFEHQDPGATWYLAIQRKGDALTNVTWASTNAAGEFTLPPEFGKAGSLVLKRSAQPTFSSMFDAHETPTP